MHIYFVYFTLHIFLLLVFQTSHYIPCSIPLPVLLKELELIFVPCL